MKKAFVKWNRVKTARPETLVSAYYENLMRARIK